MFFSLDKARSVLVCSDGGVEDAANLRRRGPIDPMAIITGSRYFFNKPHSNCLNRHLPGISSSPFLPQILAAIVK
jgi:hypothetical protein